MDPQRASKTANLVAVQRAAHQLLDEHPLILDDPFSVGLVPGSSADEIQSARAEHLQPLRKLTRSGVVLRSRFAEDMVAQAVADSVEQYLILGAGFDTYALRQPSDAKGLRIVEVDHPASQAAKLEGLKSGQLTCPYNVLFCPVDFERTSLAAGIGASNFDVQKPTIVSWLGVTMYLSRSAIEETLKFVLTLPPPSRIVLTFFAPPEPTENAQVKAHTAALMEVAAAHGEPMISLFTPAEMCKWLEDLGFSAAQYLEPADAEARYFAGRSDGLTAFTAGQNVCAYV